MNKKISFFNELIEQYLLNYSVNEHPVQKKIREINSKNKYKKCQITPIQGSFLSWLIKLIKVKNALEIGVFTGYSSLAIALALPENGKLIACDIRKETSKIALDFWKEAGVDYKIELEIAPAENTLLQLLKKGKKGFFDFAFIDADKENYGLYYEYCFDLIRPGGLIIADNVLWKGCVADNNNKEKFSVNLRNFNRKIFNDSRVESNILPISDGLMLICKK